MKILANDGISDSGVEELKKSGFEIITTVKVSPVSNDVLIPTVEVIFGVAVVVSFVVNKCTFPLSTLISVAAPKLVPITVTLAPTSGSPVSVSVTRPATVLSLIHI